MARVHEERVTRDTQPMCGWPVADEDCGNPATYFAQCGDDDGRETFRVYRCEVHSTAPIDAGDVLYDGRVVVED